MIHLDAALARAIESEARAAFPRECCGLLEGGIADGIYRILHLHPAPNIAAALDRFEIAPDAQFAALKSSRVRGNRIIGCYHSHPGGSAEPSRRDLAGAGEEGFLWLIAALRNGDFSLNAFAYSQGAFTAMSLAPTA